ncbi:hypothetical protein PSU4_22670 [Pseudonocardia sulfidoxydans NBRC 16205]|uniref:Uncharacterized protein n=1 Tax=Pseudonocardia sulfidoxydans NBRC 16205 TaxID=1223511 RepID=A0A511DFY4_9PSEU|nr:hypothetical protein PSU4_22670 [Pseudonocardia sulfidoxydans NBRC 16205]
MVVPAGWSTHADAHDEAAASAACGAAVSGNVVGFSGTTGGSTDGDPAVAGLPSDVDGPEVFWPGADGAELRPEVAAQLTPAASTRTTTTVPTRRSGECSGHCHNER